ncbi:MAG: murein biosynthesis integral membrane protein MurJ [Candidatus Pelagibacter sp. TMED165]|nr:MAG: murein biosynthesis integral membrane protein MurJ [Candidatus Pelagibacter sp. TMED165]|tara:strand:+ start:399 stop:1928 length:1530 start_codon:yes stop_codon:yes gene_type:complete
MNLIKSTGTFSLFTMVSRVLGYLRDLLIAIYLGSGPIADAFFVAFRIPNTFRRLFSEGTFNAAFVPSYSSELTKGKKKANQFANKIFNLLLIFLIITVLLIEVFMPGFIFILAPGFVENTDKLEITILLTRITFPFLLFVSLSSFFSAILNSHNRFAVAAAAPIILNIFLILVLFFGQYLNDQLVFYLSYAVSLAGITQTFFLIIFVNRFYKPKIDFNFKNDKRVKLFFKKLLPSIFSSGVTQINILIGTIIASFQASAVSYLYYADRIYQINLAIAGIAIGIIILPNLSKYVKSKNNVKINFIQNKSLELSIFLSLPAAICLLFGSKEITSALFGYGSFDEQSVNNSALALFYFAMGLPAFSIIKIFSSFLFARDNTKTPFYFSVISVLINISLSVSLFNRVGFVIIPISTSLASWINVIMLYMYISNKKYFSFRDNSFFLYIKIFISTTLASAFFLSLIKLFKNNLIYESDYKLFFIIILVLLTFTIYILISAITKAFNKSDIKLKY